MQVVVLNSKEAIADSVSEILIAQVQKKPDSVLGFATGSSPILTYQRLIEQAKRGKVSFQNVTTFNLDEYCGLEQSDPDSYYDFMRRQLFEPAGFDFKKVRFLEGTADDHEAVCKAYRAAIEQAGGIDIQLLGIGRNGHIGFNEPGDRFSDGPFMTKLAQSTLDANSRFFPGSRPPRFALTMGIGDILAARRILLIATGEEKADAVYAMVCGTVTPQCPASALQNHPDVTVFLDHESAKHLPQTQSWKEESPWLHS